MGEARPVRAAAGWCLGAPVKVSDGFHLWSEQFDCELDDIFAIQDTIGAAIVQALEATILGGVQVAGIRADAVLGTYGALAPRDAMPLARLNAVRALALDPSLAEPHATPGLIAVVFEHEWAKSEASFGQALIEGGRHAEAKACFERAIALTGGSAEMLSRLAQAKAGLGDVDGAGADLDALKAGRSERYTPASQVALVHIALGQHAAAMEWLRTAQREDDPELIYLTTKRVYAPLRSRQDFVDLVRAVRLEPKAATR